MKTVPAVLTGLAVAGLAALTPAVAHAQDAPTSCQAKGTFRQIQDCTAAYAAAHPSHDAYFYGPMHFRGRTNETFLLVGGIAGDKYSLQYCRAGAWHDAAAATVGADHRVSLPTDFASIPKDANAFRARNTSAGITSWQMSIGDPAYADIFTGKSASCGAGAGSGTSATKTASAPSSAPARKEGDGGLSKTGF